MQNTIYSPVPGAVSAPVRIYFVELPSNRIRAQLIAPQKIQFEIRSKGMPEQNDSLTVAQWTASFDSHKPKKPLSKEEFDHLVASVKLREPSSVEQLVASMLGLLMKTAASYSSHHTSMVDLLNEGIVGLLNAADRYEASRGIKFSTYAMSWIRGEMLEHINKSQPIRASGSMRRLQTRVLRASQTLTMILGRDPTAMELAEEMGVAESKIRRILGLNHARVYSRDQDADNQNLVELEHNTPCVSEFLASREVCENLSRALGFLSAGDSKIIQHVLSSPNKNNLGYSDYAKENGTTRSEAQKMGAKAMKELKAILESMGLDRDTALSSVALIEAASS